MSKYKEKIKKVFEHPISTNIDVKKLIKALEHFGVEVEHTKHNKIKLLYKEEEYFIPIPHTNTLSKDLVVEVRHFLEKIGLTPDSLD